MTPDVDNILKQTALMLKESTPELKPDELNAIVSEFISRRDVFLRLNEKHNSPLYVVEPEILSERAAQFTSAFRRVFPDARIYYALKSNNCPQVVQILAGSGLGLDVSSGMELQIALDSGARDIIFSGPGKTPDELNLAVKNHDKVTVLMDSFTELDRLQETALSGGVRVRAGVRITTGQHGIWRKFGIPLTDLPAFMGRAEKCSHIDLQGVQSHVSWNLNPTKHVEIIKAIGAAFALFSAEQKKRIKFLDIGGGFWPPQGEWLQESGTAEGRILHAVSERLNPAFRHFKQPAVGIEQFASAIGTAVKEYIFPQLSCRICLEPGRWLCNDAMHLLMTVIDKKANDLVITDAGINAVGWERFENDYFPVINLSNPSLTERECLVMGSLCTPHDLWGYSYYGAAIEPGNVLLIPHQGAYTYSLKQEFIKPLPKVVCVQDDPDCRQ